MAIEDIPLRIGEKPDQDIILRGKYFSYHYCESRFYKTYAVWIDFELLKLSERLNGRTINTIKNLDFLNGYQPAKYIHGIPVSIYTTRATGMFENCVYLTDVDLSNWEFPSDINWFDCRYMFNKCDRLVSVKLPNFPSIVNTSFHCEYMFNKCGSLENVELGAFPEVINEGFYISFMFAECSHLASIELPKFPKIIKKGLYCAYMFHKCFSLMSIDVPVLPDVIEEMVYMSYMFNGCVSLYSITFPKFPKTHSISCDGIFTGTNLGKINMNEDDLEFIKRNA